MQKQMSSTKASSVRSNLLLRSGNLSRLTLCWVNADQWLRATSTPSSQSLIYKNKNRQALRRSCDAGIQSAQSGDCVLLLAGARRYEANYRGIAGEHWAQYARVRRQREEHTLAKRQSWGPSNDGGLKMVNWQSQSKNTPQIPEDGHIYCILLIRIANHNTRPPPRVRKTDTFIVFPLSVLHSITCPKTCHLAACDSIL